MKKLSEDLKRVLTGLAHQHAGEFLPMRDKMRALGYLRESGKRPLATTRGVATRAAAAKRIALISDGRGLGAPLNYAIDACQRQDAQIDLLLHGTVDKKSLSLMEEQIKQAKLDYEILEFGVNSVDSIISYIYNRPSLIFLVAMPDDTAAKTLIEEVIPKRGERIPVPLVLIEENQADNTHKRSAA